MDGQIENSLKSSGISDLLIIHDMCFLVTNRNQFSEYVDSSSQTMSLIGLIIDTTFVLTNRPVILKGL